MVEVHQDDLVLVDGRMVFEHRSDRCGDFTNQRNILVSQPDAYLDATVVHSPGIFNRLCRENRIRDVKRATLKGANFGVIPADFFDGSFQAIGANPIAFFEGAIEIEHESCEEVLGDLLRAEANSNAGAS